MPAGRPADLPENILAQAVAAGAPFVLLDDARGGDQMPAAARLFTDPVETLVAAAPDGIDAVLAGLDRWQADGATVAGFLAYEAGLALVPWPGHAAPPRGAAPADWPLAWPLAWFACFARQRRIDAWEMPALLPDPAGAAVGLLQPGIDYLAYARRIEAILDHIVAGDIYQANATFAADVAVHGAPLALYARLRATAGAGYGGLLFTGTHWLLSFSPELFLSIRGDRILSRPMKGTARRGTTPAADAAAVAALAGDAKQQAENLMIVDLIRNDISRVALPGSVAVPDLFRVETYPTIHQMVSTVTARLLPATPISAVLRATFPCGSITGAPKIRAMEIIDTIETTARGAYTGAIGFIAPAADDGSGIPATEAAFNVAIRTLALRDGDGRAMLGLGSGIVADSVPALEWQECLAKGGFVNAAVASFDLLETMHFDPRDGFARLDAHLARIGDSARAFGFGFDRHLIRNMLQHATFRQRSPARVRLRLSPAGNVAIEVVPPATPPQTPVSVAIVPLPVDPADIRLRHKTSDRAFYDDARRGTDCFEVLLEDSAGRLTEGSFTSLFVERGGTLLTPAASLGLLPGVLRAALIAEGRAQEAVLTRADLTQGFFIGNAARGLIAARLVD